MLLVTSNLFMLDELKILSQNKSGLVKYVEKMGTENCY